MKPARPTLGSLRQAPPTAPCVALVLLAAGLVMPAIGYAQSPPPTGATGNLGDFNTFATIWQNFITTQLQPKLTAILQGTGTGGVNYVQWSNSMLAGGFVITVLLALYRWVFGGMTNADLVAVFAKGAIIAILYESYTTWTPLFFNAAFQLSFAIQDQALGDQSVMGPAAFVFKAFSAVDFGSDSIFTLTIAGAFYALIFLVIEVVLIVASFFVAAWPTLLYAVAVIVGPIMFPFLFIEPLSGFFDGWVKLYFSSLFFMIISRVVLIVVALLFGSFFGVSYSLNPSIQPMVIDASSLANVGVLFVLSGMSLFLLFYSGSLVATIVGGTNLGMSGAVVKLARFAAAAAMA